MSEPTLISERARRFVVKRRITHELLKMELNRPYFLRIDGKIADAPPTKRAKGREPVASKYETPPRIAMVTDFSESDEGVPMQIIVHWVLESELSSIYPNDAYVGKLFQITRHKIEGKTYHGYQVSEVDWEGEAPKSTKRK